MPYFVSLRRRLASMLYESLLLLGILSVGFMLPEIALGAIDLLPPPAITGLHFVVVIGIYFIWYWRHSGQTLAMQTWKIRLESVRGGTPEPWQLGLRYVLTWPSLLFFGVGIVWALVDRDRQFMHDRLAGTRLVRADA